jgi:hypothetical protein
MTRALFWAGVALTIALVAFGIWYYVHDDYPFQLTSDQIAGLSYHSVPTSSSVSGSASGSDSGSVSGYISDPPVELAGWVSSMEKDSSDETVAVTTVVTVVQTDGRLLRLFLGGSRGYGRWVEPDGSESTPVGVQLNQAFVWYVQGVGDALAASRQAEPQVTPSASPASSTPSPTVSPSP